MRDILSLEQNVLRFEIPVGDAMVMQFPDPQTNLINDLQRIFFGHAVLRTVIKRIPESGTPYHRDPPSQYSTMYQMQLWLSIMSNIFKMC
jgi:hypothetical protein